MQCMHSVADPEDRARGGEGGLGAVPPAGVQAAEPHWGSGEAPQKLAY